MKLKYYIMLLPPYALSVIGSAFSASLLPITAMCLSLVISSLLVSIIFMICVLNNPIEMKKTNFYLVFYSLLHLVPCFIIPYGIVFYLISFLFGLLIYLNGEEYIYSSHNACKKNNEDFLDNKNFSELKSNPNSLANSMAHYSKDINQAIAMESAFK